MVLSRSCICAVPPSDCFKKQFHVDKVSRQSDPRRREGLSKSARVAFSKHDFDNDICTSSSSTISSDDELYNEHQKKRLKVGGVNGNMNVFDHLWDREGDSSESVAEESRSSDETMVSVKFLIADVLTLYAACGLDKRLIFSRCSASDESQTESYRLLKTLESKLTPHVQVRIQRVVTH